MKNITIDFHTLKGDWQDDLHFHGGDEEWSEAEVKELTLAILKICEKKKKGWVNHASVDFGIHHPDTSKKPSSAQTKKNK